MTKKRTRTPYWTGWDTRHADRLIVINTVCGYSDEEKEPPPVARTHKENLGLVKVQDIRRSSPVKRRPVQPLPSELLPGKPTNNNGLTLKKPVARPTAPPRTVPLPIAAAREVVDLTMVDPTPQKARFPKDAEPDFLLEDSPSPHRPAEGRLNRLRKMRDVLPGDGQMAERAPSDDVWSDSGGGGAVRVLESPLYEALSPTRNMQAETGDSAERAGQGSRSASGESGGGSGGSDCSSDGRGHVLDIADRPVSDAPSPNINPATPPSPASRVSSASSPAANGIPAEAEGVPRTPLQFENSISNQLGIVVNLLLSYR